MMERLILIMEINPTLAASILRARGAASGMLQVAKELHIGPARLVNLVRNLSDKGLVEVQRVRSRSAGRPLVKVIPTPLGNEYLAAYEALDSKILKSRRSDLLRAVADARYAQRLVERGLAPTALSLELSSFVLPLRRPAR